MKTYLKLGLFTLVIFGLGGVLLIEYVQNRSTIEVLQAGESIFVQLGVGVLTGIGASAIALGIIKHQFFQQERYFYHGLISSWDLDRTGMVFLSICAGIGEELFFRGGIQPLIGNWWTSVIFVLLHGYLNPKNWRISIYGTFMVGIIYVFGILYEHVGIVSAMVAHTVLDITLFRYMNNLDGEKTTASNQ